jgi:hypothetical protein
MVSNQLSSVLSGLAQSLDGKRGEEARGYTFIAPIQRFRVGNPGFLGGFGWGDVRLRLGHDGREEDAADSGVPPVSDSESEGREAAAALWAGSR